MAHTRAPRPSCRAPSRMVTLTSPYLKRCTCSQQQATSGMGEDLTVQLTPLHCFASASLMRQLPCRHRSVGSHLKSDEQPASMRRALPKAAQCAGLLAPAGSLTAVKAWHAAALLSQPTCCLKAASSSSFVTSDVAAARLAASSAEARKAGTEILSMCSRALGRAGAAEVETPTAGKMPCSADSHMDCSSQRPRRGSGDICRDVADLWCAETRSRLAPLVPISPAEATLLVLATATAARQDCHQKFRHCACAYTPFPGGSWQCDHTCNLHTHLFNIRFPCLHSCGHVQHSPGPASRVTRTVEIPSGGLLA